MSLDRWLRVEFVDGTSETFSFPKQVDDDYEQMQKFRAAMRAETVDRPGQAGSAPVSMTMVARRLDRTMMFS